MDELQTPCEAVAAPPVEAAPVPAPAVVKRHEIRMLCEKGDVKVSWNPNDPDEVKNAEAVFKTLKEKGHLFFRVKKEKKKFGWGLISVKKRAKAAEANKGEKVSWFDGTAGELIAEFDPKAEKVVATPMVSGG